MQVLEWVLRPLDTLQGQISIGWWSRSACAALLCKDGLINVHRSSSPPFTSTVPRVFLRQPHRRIMGILSVGRVGFLVF